MKIFAIIITIVLALVLAEPILNAGKHVALFMGYLAASFFCQIFFDP
jgi:hypothetical protein